jgi:hypothetical protein
MAVSSQRHAPAAVFLGKNHEIGGQVVSRSGEDLQRKEKSFATPWIEAPEPPALNVIAKQLILPN